MQSRTYRQTGSDPRRQLHAYPADNGIHHCKKENNNVNDIRMVC